MSAATIIGLLASTVTTQPPAQSCPGPLQGRWFRSEYHCGRVEEVEWPRANDPTIHREWAATYVVEGNVVTVLLDGRWRDRRDGAPEPHWNRSKPSRRTVSIHGCLGVSDRIWPRYVYREGDCVVPYGAYAWSPGAPRGTPLPPAIYEGHVSADGVFRPTLDPHARMFAAGTPVTLSGWLPGRVRFLGSEPRERVDGAKERRISMLVDLNARRNAYPNALKAATTETDRARLAVEDGRLTEAAAHYDATATILLRLGVSLSRTRPDVMQFHREVRSLVNLDPKDPSWRAKADLIETRMRGELSRAWEVHRQDKGLPVERARLLLRDAHVVRLLLSTQEGLREAEAIEESARSIHAGVASTPDTAGRVVDDQQVTQ